MQIFRSICKKALFVFMIGGALATLVYANMVARYDFGRAFLVFVIGIAATVLASSFLGMYIECCDNIYEIKKAVSDNQSSQESENFQ